MKRNIDTLKLCSRSLKYCPACNINATKAYLYTIRNINDCIVYIWLKNGKEFWYFVKYVGNHVLSGYIKIKERWVYKPIKIRDICGYY